MSWLIKCSDSNCKEQTWAENIVDLINNHRDDQGWLMCRCGKHGYIEKGFDLQEPDERWEPMLRGLICLGDSAASYQPFVFLVSDDPTGPATDVWFSYFKDLRATGGRLKLGYGPGGPPVLGKAKLLQLIHELIGIGVLTKEEVQQSVQ